jgi:hypothetical protein
MNGEHAKRAGAFRLVTLGFGLLQFEGETFSIHL